MQGPREGFVEDVKTNLSLVKRKLRTTHLTVKRFTLGRLTSTHIAVVYIEKVAAKEVVDNIVSRISKIDVDGVLDVNYVKEYLEPNPSSVFPQSAVTEKPDVAAAKLLEGRVAIIVDGSPMVMTLPYMLVEDFQSAEDYYERSVFSTFLRFVRLFGALLAVFLPGLYVALQIFHYSVIPIRFLLTLTSSVNGIPFRPLSETLFVIFLFELIREAGIRTPKAVGMAMSIVGALVLGDTAVKAGIISTPAVMLIALSSLCMYTVPNQVGTMSLIRVIFTVLGGVGGLYLLMCGGALVIWYLSSLNGYGTAYLSPLSPLELNDLKDSFARVSMRKMKYRPLSLVGDNKRRRK
jgi:spore germination protein KA